MPEDYEQLAKLGVDVKGKIVIARYGQQLARHQAEGRLRARRGRLHHLFGSARRRLLPGRRRIPTGPYRPEQGVQRGSVMDMPIYPGDPLTPGMGVRAGRRAGSIAATRRRS